MNLPEFDGYHFVMLDMGLLLNAIKGVKMRDEGSIMTMKGSKKVLVTAQSLLSGLKMTVNKKFQDSGALYCLCLFDWKNEKGTYQKGIGYQFKDKFVKGFPEFKGDRQRPPTKAEIEQLDHNDENYEELHFQYLQEKEMRKCIHQFIENPPKDCIPIYKDGFEADDLCNNINHWCSENKIKVVSMSKDSDWVYYLRKGTYLQRLTKGEPFYNYKKACKELELEWYTEFFGREVSLIEIKSIHDAIMGNHDNLKGNNLDYDLFCDKIKHIEDYENSKEDSEYFTWWKNHQRSYRMLKLLNSDNYYEDLKEYFVPILSQYV